MFDARTIIEVPLCWKLLYTKAIFYLNIESRVTFTHDPDVSSVRMD